MRKSLGTDEHTYDARHKGLKYFKKFRHWKKGFKAGKKGVLRKENPYTLTPDIISLLKKRTMWDLGWEEASYTPTKKRLRKEEEDRKKRERKASREHKHSKSSKHKHSHRHKEYK